MSPAFHWLQPLITHTVDQATPPTADMIGGKALSILRLGKAGAPVPQAWVIPIDACVDYHAQNRHLPSDLVFEVRQLLEQTLPLPVAVRSGAAVSMPGMLRTVLNCCTVDAVITSIMMVFDSWKSPEAQLYRQRQRRPDLLGTAVIIQRMVPTTVAGVLFTRDPQQPEHGPMVIEAVQGSGEALVSGDQTGQRWIIPRNHTPPVRSRSDAPSWLGAAQQESLIAWGLRIESIYGEPVDVEWGFDGDDLWFFQVRPIDRTAERLEECPTESDQLLVQENQRLAEYRNRGQCLWVRHSLCESLPHPTPLTWSLIRKMMNGHGGYGALFRQLGFVPSERFCRDGFLDLFAGEIYASLEQLPDLYSCDFPFGFDREEVLSDPGALERGPRRLDLDRVGPWFLLRSPAILWRMWRARRTIQKQIRTSHQRFMEIDLPDCRAWVDAERSRSLQGSSTQDLIGIWKQRVHTILDQFTPRLMLSGILGGAALDQLGRELSANSSPDDAESCRQRIMENLSIPVLNELTSGIIEWNQNRDDKFLKRFGHRCSEEMELRQRTWSEAPDSVPPGADSHPRPTSHDNLDGIQKLLAKLDVRSRRRVLDLLQRIPELLADREVGKDEWLRGYATIRDVCRRLETATGLDDDLYFLSQEELERFPAIPERCILQQRREEWEERQRLPHPAIIDERGLLPDSLSVSSAGDCLSGVTISPGAATGIAWVASTSCEALVPPKDAIVVTRLLRPADVVRWAAVRGIIVEQAAMLSHGAILVRQFGIPTVQLTAACQLIRSGDGVRVADSLVHVDGQSVTRPS